MKNNIKKLFSLFVAFSLCMAIAIPVFAEENSTDASAPNCASYTLEVTSDEVKVVRSSVSGYGSKILTSQGSGNGILVSCNGSGWGGMGITIDTHCSQGNYTIEFIGTSTIGFGSDISGIITTNDHIVFEDLIQRNLSEYMIVFTIPEGVSVSVEVWIYG